MHLTSKLLLAAAATGVAATAAGAAALHAAPAGPAIERHVYFERELASPTLDLGRHGFSPLDRQVITSDILDAHGKVVGRMDADCGITAVGKRSGAVCSSVLTFANGQLVGTRFDDLGRTPDAPQPITGGSGAYMGARGEVRLLRETTQGDEFEIDLLR